MFKGLQSCLPLDDNLDRGNTLQLRPWKDCQKLEFRTQRWKQDHSAQQSLRYNVTLSYLFLPHLTKNILIKEISAVVSLALYTMNLQWFLPNFTPMLAANRMHTLSWFMSSQLKHLEAKDSEILGLVLQISAVFVQCCLVRSIKRWTDRNDSNDAWERRDKELDLGWLGLLVWVFDGFDGGHPLCFAT